MANIFGWSCNKSWQKWLFSSQSGWWWQHWTCCSCQSRRYSRRLHHRPTSRQQIHHKEVHFQAQKQFGNKCISCSLEEVDKREKFILSTNWWKWRQRIKRIMFSCHRQSNFSLSISLTFHLIYEKSALFVELCWKKNSSLDLSQKRSGRCENPWNHQTKSSFTNRWNCGFTSWL